MLERETLSTHAEYEMSMIDLWEILVRRKGIVLGFLAACLIAAGVHLALAVPIYESRASVRIGQVADAGLLEEPDVLAARLIGKYGEEIATGIKRPLPFLKSSASQKNAKQIVDLVVYGDTPEQSAAFLRRIAEDVIARHRETYNSEFDLARQRIEQIKNQQRLLNELFIGSADLLDTLKRRDPVQASLLTQERGRIAGELSVTERELPPWLQKLNPPKTTMSELLGEVTAPARPVLPRKVFVLAAALMLGGLGGVTLAFAGEFLAKARRLNAVG